MGIVNWIVIGLIAGVLAKWIMPGKDPGGIVVTVLRGIVGASVGGFLVGLLMPGDVITGINITTVVVASLGAIAAGDLPADRRQGWDRRQLLIPEPWPRGPAGAVSELAASRRCGR